MFSLRGLRLYFPALEPWVALSALLPTLFFPIYLCANVGPRGMLAATLPALLHNLPHCWVCQPQPRQESSPPWLPVSAPPTVLDECFFFISWVVGLPYSSIFCQFWLFFVFKLLLSFFWLCEEAQCVHLCLHLGWKLRKAYRGLGFLGHIASSTIAVSKGSSIFSFVRKFLTVYHISSAVGSLFSASSPALLVCRFINDGHSDRCEVIPHFGFNFHLCDG